MVEQYLIEIYGCRKGCIWNIAVGSGRIRLSWYHHVADNARCDIKLFMLDELANVQACLPDEPW